MGNALVPEPALGVQQPAAPIEPSVPNVSMEVQPAVEIDLAPVPSPPVEVKAKAAAEPNIHHGVATASEKPALQSLQDPGADSCGVKAAKQKEEKENIKQDSCSVKAAEQKEEQKNIEQDSCSVKAAEQTEKTNNIEQDSCSVNAAEQK